MKREIVNEELKESILSLCACMSVSGFECRAAALLREKYGADFDEISTDGVGNHILIKRCGREGAPLALIDTHFDEIGMMVTEICEGGFLRIAPLGGLSLPVLQGADVVVYGAETIRGVITSTPPHLRHGSGSDALTALEELAVDTGYPKEELEELAPVGTPIGFAPVYSELRNGQLAGKSFDNKACAAIAAYALGGIPREELAADVALLLSCCEETTGGARAASFGLSPDYAMVVDVNLARVPSTPAYETVPLGEGVSLSISAATDRRLTRMTQTLCEDGDIPFTRIAAPSSTGTNAVDVALTGRGIPVVDVGLPLKNMHTYNEVISMTDARSLCRLVEEFACSRAIAEAFGEAGEEELV